MRFYTWQVNSKLLSSGGERTQTLLRKEAIMLKQLSQQDMQEVTGGLGIVEFYIDKNGKLAHRSRPAGPKFGGNGAWTGCVRPPKFPIRK
jgi:hypothetical protein